MDQGIQTVTHNSVCFSTRAVLFESRKTKTKVITLTNHNRRKQHNGPIRIQSKCM